LQAQAEPFQAELGGQLVQTPPIELNPMLQAHAFPFQAELAPQVEQTPLME
jgi:hypothetical protein